MNERFFTEPSRGASSTKALPGVPGSTAGSSSRPRKRRVGAPSVLGATPMNAPEKAALTEDRSVRVVRAPTCQNTVPVRRESRARGSSRAVTSKWCRSRSAAIFTTWPTSSPW